jgi:hypothetical protein
MTAAALLPVVVVAFAFVFGVGERRGDGGLNSGGIVVVVGKRVDSQWGAQ